ncbi:MAG: hypothetical protein AAFV98_08010 [Chloroflexota bacterium]
MCNKGNTETRWSKAIRAHVRPFEAMPIAKENQTFVVGWHPEPLAFMAIVEAIKKSITTELVYYRKVPRQDILDMLQQGWLRLWQDLQENPQLLSDKSRLATSDYVANRCGSSNLLYYYKCYTSYHGLSKWSEPDSEVFEDKITDIVIGSSSLKSTGRGKHALFTRKVDIYLDISRAIQEVAEWCGDNIKKLAALYFVTTSVHQVDAGRIAGLKIEERKGRKPRCVGMQYWSKIVREKLQEVFSSYKPIESNKYYWRECIKKGELDPVIALAEKYADDPSRLLALYTLTTQVSKTTILNELGVSLYAFKYAVGRVRQELRCLYARRVPLVA